MGSSLTLTIYVDSLASYAPYQRAVIWRAQQVIGLSVMMTIKSGKFNHHMPWAKVLLSNICSGIGPADFHYSIVILNIASGRTSGQQLIYMSKKKGKTVLRRLIILKSLSTSLMFIDVDTGKNKQLMNVIRGQRWGSRIPRSAHWIWKWSDDQYDPSWTNGQDHLHYARKQMKVLMNNNCEL
jgi:hypothetical protein